MKKRFRNLDVLDYAVVFLFVFMVIGALHFISQPALNPTLNQISGQPATGCYPCVTPTPYPQQYGK